MDWDTTENLYIEGDNLEVLKLLQESYLGKVKLIYIDPPSEVYEINPNSFIGADKLEHIVVKGKNTKIVQRGDKNFTPPEDFYIVGPRGSFAESYAKELGITFEAF